MDEINRDLEVFRGDYNSHKLSTKEAHGHSPKVREPFSECSKADWKHQEMYVIGQLTEGVYRDEFAGIHPDVIARYHGTVGRPVNRPTGHTGTGHDPFESDTINEECITRNVANDQDQNFIDAVEAPNAEPPFTTDQAFETFKQVLAALSQSNYIPPSFELHHEALGTTHTEQLTLGRSGRRFLTIPLRHEIWHPRLVLWTQGITALVHCKERLVQ